MLPFKGVPCFNPWFVIDRFVFVKISINKQN